MARSQALQPKTAPRAAPRTGNTIQPLFGRKTKTGFGVGHAGLSVGNVAVSAPNSLFVAGQVIGATSSSAKTAGDVFGAVGAASSSAAVVTLPVGIGLWAVSSGFAARSIYKSYHHKKGLEECHRGLRQELEGRSQTAQIFLHHDGAVPPELLEQINHMVDALEAIEYTIRQKSRKMKRKGGSIVPVLGAPIVGLHRLGRYLFKKNRGKTRSEMAKKLWDAHQYGIEWATMAIHELWGESRTEKLTERGDDAKSLLHLERKMKSI